MAFDSNGNLIETDDGGIYRWSVPVAGGPGQWTSLNGNLQLTEITSISYDNNTKTLISGNQDNGSGYQTLVGGNSVWTLQTLADGGATAINDENLSFSVRYLSSQRLGAFTRIMVDPSNNIMGNPVLTNLKVGTESLQDYEDHHHSAIPFQAPVRVNQNDEAMVAIGTQIVYVAREDFSNGLTTDLKLTPITTAFESSLADIAFGRPGNTDLILAGEGNRLWLLNTAIPDHIVPFTQLTSYHGRGITSVFINPNSDSQFYAADGQTVRSTVDQGQNWTTGLSLPQLRSLQFIGNGLNAVVVGGYGTLYAARDTDLNNWYSLTGNLPNTFVWSMDYGQDDTLAVGTLGYGAFTLPQASTLMPAAPLATDPVETGWIRLLRLNPQNQTLNGGALQNPDSVPLAMTLTLNALGGTFDTTGPDPDSGISSTLTGVVSGPGSLTVTGNGVLSLTGANTYLGGTFLNAGTLNVAGPGNLGAGGLIFNGGTLQNGAPFTFARDITLNPYGGAWETNSFDATLSGTISGPGTLTKTGLGTLTLSGINTYSGGTLINGGALMVTSDANLGASGSPISFNAGNPQSLTAPVLVAGGNLTGTRTLVVLGSGVFDTGTFTSSFTGEFFGYGAFTQQGTGSLTLGGDASPFQGTYTVTGGTFTLNNAPYTLGSTLAPCRLEINSPASWSGNGNLVGALTNQGTISPGHSPGTLNVVGSFAQAPGGTYIAEIASLTSYDKIVVTGNPGTASLAGAVSPVLLGGYRPPANTVFSGVVSATGGVTGTFSSVINQFLGPTLFWQTRYTANSFDLVVGRDYANPALGLNRNQLAVGNMLNGLAGVTSGDLNKALNAIDNLPTAAAVRDAYKQLSPEKAAALANLGFVAANFQVRNLATRTTNLRFALGDSASGGGSASGGLGLNYSRLDGVMLAYNGASISDLFSARKEFKLPDSRWGVFADGGAAFGSQNSSVNQTGYNFSLGGFTLGADYRLRDNLLVGLATGYSHTGSSFYGSGGRVNASSVPFNAYVAYFPGSLYAYGSLGYALNLFDLDRGLNFGGLSRTASGSTTGHQFNLYGETGYDLRLGRLILTPSATLAYSALWVGGFTEQDAGALNLKVASQQADSLQTGVGGRLTVPLKVGSVKVVPQAYAFFQHEFSNGSRGLNASLSQAGGAFNFQTDAAGSNFARLGASVTAGLKKNLYAQVNYNADVGRSNSSAHYVNAGLRFEF